MESAELVGSADPELARTMRERGLTYIDGFLGAPDDLERGVYLLGYNHVTGEVINDMPIWGSIYGMWPACYVALVCVCGYRLTSNAGLLEWAESVGERYIEEPLPGSIAVPSMDAGLALGLLVELYRISGDKRRLDRALAPASRLADVYLDGDLVRGAAGIDWYESQMGPGFLLHGLASVALAKERGSSDHMRADYTAR